MNLIMAIVVVLVVRYYSDDDKARLLAVQMSYGTDMTVCEKRKAEADKTPDPVRTKTRVDCIEEKDLPRLLSGGKDT